MGIPIEKFCDTGVPTIGLVSGLGEMFIGLGGMLGDAVCNVFCPIIALCCILAEDRGVFSCCDTENCRIGTWFGVITPVTLLVLTFTAAKI